MKTNFKNKTILITGGTGSFGRSFAERVIKFGPKKIIIFSRDEQKHNEMMISEEFKNIKQMRYFIGDIRDLNRLILATKNVDIIIHAAAMKHVHLCEYNPIECVNTNIIGAKNLVEASITNNVKNLLQFQLIKLLIQLIYMALANLLLIKFSFHQIIFLQVKLNFQLLDMGTLLDQKEVLLTYIKI